MIVNIKIKMGFVIKFNFFANVTLNSRVFRRYICKNVVNIILMKRVVRY